MSLPSQPSRQAVVAEIIKCGKDPIYFMKKYCKIQHPIRGLIPFDTYDFQDECIKDFQKHRFNIILKSRQLGLSTISAAYCVWFAIFKKDKNVLVIATKLATAINFIKKVKAMLDGLPPWLLLTKFEPTKQSIRFTNGSTITAVPTSPDAGRSEALALLVVDECVVGETQIEVLDTVTNQEKKISIEDFYKLVLYEGINRDTSYIYMIDEEDMDEK